jgi:cytochrome b6-f complex iron-sulfur subunit
MKIESVMERRDFYALLGVGAAGIVMSCLGCSKSSAGGGNSSTAGASGVDFTLDLSATASAPLLKSGGYLVSNGVLVAKTTAGAYIAVQQSCTHESYPLAYQAGNQRFYCNNHGATFNEKGAVTNGPANRALSVYNTTLTGTSLRVYS